MTVKDMGQPVSASIVWQQKRGEKIIGGKTVGEEIDMGQSRQRAGKSKWKQSSIRMEAKNRIKSKRGLRQSPATIEWQAKSGDNYRAKIYPKSNNCNTSI